MNNHPLTKLAIPIQEDNNEYVQQQITEKVTDTLTNIYKEIYRILCDRINSIEGNSLDTNLDLESYGDRLQYITHTINPDVNYVMLDNKLILTYQVQTSELQTNLYIPNYQPTSIFKLIYE